MEHGGQSEKLGGLGHVNIQSRIFSVPCLIHQVRIGLPRCQVKFSFTIVGSYHHHPIYMTSPGVFDEQGLCWNPCFLFAGATLRLGGVSTHFMGILTHLCQARWDFPSKNNGNQPSNGGPWWVVENSNIIVSSTLIGVYCIPCHSGSASPTWWLTMIWFCVAIYRP